MMQGLQEVEPLESLDPINELQDSYKIGLLTDRSARTIDDIFNKLPYTDEKKNLHILEWKTFIISVKENHWEIDKIKTGNLNKKIRRYL